MGRHWFEKKRWFIFKMWPFKPKCVPLAKATRMSDSQRASAVKRKRAKAQGVGGKPTNVPTFAKRKKAMMGGFMGRRMGIR